MNFDSHTDVEYQSDAGARPKRLRIAIWLLWLAWTTCVVGSALIIAGNVESVLVTGPIILLLGIATMFCGARSSCNAVRWVGLAFCCICVLFFSLVQAFSWSPSGAKLPFTVMAPLFTLIMLPIVIRTTRLAAAVRISPWACTKCGYLLYGLTQPRCPECGTPFDESLLQS